MMNKMKPSPYRIMQIVSQTTAESTFRVAYEGNVKDGQFFMLSIPKVGEAPISVSGKGVGYVEFTIRKVGRLTEGVFELQEGNSIFMRGPYGTFWPIEQFEGKPLIVICGGTGMAPVKTLLEYFYQKDAKDVYLIAGFRDASCTLFDEERKLFSKKFQTIYTLDTGAADGYEGGFVTQHIHQLPLAQLPDANIVIVGPPPMMRATALECIQQGAKIQQIWVSFERKMSCAIGKCGHCKINETYVCTEGPVFPYEKASRLFD